MSYYLNPNNALKRLRREWEAYGGLIVAVDFDSTLKPFKFEETKGDGGFEINFEVAQLVKDLHEAGCTIIIFTASEEQRHDEIKKYLAKWEIPYHHFNENSPKVKYTGGKVYANAYLDDRAGLYQVYNHLSTLLLEQKTKQVKNYFKFLARNSY